ncbi:MAG: serine hydrolase [Rubrivivax sp.]|nr:serine hydrolase [Rubrivivax sp.]
MSEIVPALAAIRTDRGAPAAGAAVLDQGELVLRVEGLPTQGSQDAVRPQDRWHLGSVAKSMTATLVGALGCTRAVCHLALARSSARPSIRMPARCKRTGAAADRKRSTARP